MSEHWILGKKYELPKDLEAVMDLIEDARDRRASNDLSAIAFQLIHMVLEKDALVATGVEVVEDFLPNIGNCALQDIGRLNHFLIDAKAGAKN